MPGGIGTTGTTIGSINVSIGANTARLQRGLRQARVMIGGFGRLAAAGAATAGVAIFALSRRYEMLNRAMLRSQAIMKGITPSVNAEMLETALQVSSRTQFSTREIARGYFYLASAGMDAKQSIAALNQVALFAQAGNFDMATATDLATDAQSAMGLKVKDAAQNLVNLTRVTDVFTRVNTAANATIQQFSEALTTKAGGALRIANKSIEEGVAVLAVFADQGLKAQKAGVALAIVLRDLQTKAIRNAAEFKRLGISVFDTTGEMRHMADIIGNIEQRMAGLTTRGRKKLLLDLGFTDKSVAATQLLIGFSDAIRDYEKIVRDVSMTTKSVAEASLTAFQKAIAKLGSAFDRLSQSMAPVVAMMTKMVELVAQATEFISDPSKPGVAAGRGGVSYRESLNAPGSLLERPIQRMIYDTVSGMIAQPAAVRAGNFPATGYEQPAGTRRGQLGRTATQLRAATDAAKIIAKEVRFAAYAVRNVFNKSEKKIAQFNAALALGKDVASVIPDAARQIGDAWIEAGKKVDAKRGELAKSLGYESVAEFTEKMKEFSIGGQGKFYSEQVQGALKFIARNLLTGNVETALGLGHGMGAKKQREIRDLSFVETGSAESFRRRELRARQTKQDKIAKKQLAVLEKVEKNTRKDEAKDANL